MPAPAPFRRQMIWRLSLVLMGLVLSAGALSAWWTTRLLESQAEDAARSLAQVVAQGGFALTPAVIKRMEQLAGYQFLVDPDRVPQGALRVEAGGRVLAVLYRTEAFAARQRAVFLATVVASALVLGLALLLGWWWARSHAAPLEQLEQEAQRLGEGDWDTPIALPTANRELRALAGTMEQARLALRKLSEAQRRDERLATLGTVTATIAHEVRNPISAVQLLVQLLQHEQPHNALTRIAQELERLELTVDELLSFARGVTVELLPCNLAEVVADVLRLLERQAAHAGVELSLHGEALVLGDARRLRQLTMNVVLNAMQAQPEGGWVRIEVLSDGFAVSDGGPGVAPEMQERLFQAFASAKAHGNGLGLHIAQAFAQAQGAKLSYRSTAAGGACFVLSGLKAAVSA